MKHKEKRQEYARQYQNMSAKELSCFLGRKEIQFRRSTWLSEVLGHKTFSRGEILNKAYWRRISYDRGWGVLIFKKTKLQSLIGRQKSSRLCEDAKGLISRTKRALSMRRRMGFSAG